jgi:hypothetical protein
MCSSQDFGFEVVGCGGKGERNEEEVRRSCGK